MVEVTQGSAKKAFSYNGKRVWDETEVVRDGQSIVYSFKTVVHAAELF